MNLSTLFRSKLVRNAAVLIIVIVAIAAFPVRAISQQQDPLLHYQGRVSVGDVVFEGKGHFKFALVNRTGDETYWSHDGSGTGGSEPATAVELPVNRGLYSVRLGEPGVMNPILPEVFEKTDLHLRIWFDDGVHGFEQLSPDQPFVPTAYAQRAAAAEIATTALEASTVAIGSIGPAQLDSDFEANLAKLDGDAVFSGAVTAGSFVGDGANLSNIFTESLVYAGNRVVEWGAYHGETAPPDLTDVVAIAGGSDHTLALRSDGTVVGWGRISRALAIPSDLRNVVAIATGNEHSLALQDDGTVVVWGNRNYDQTAVPPGLSDVVAIDAGFRFSLALKSDGTVVAWGGNSGESNVPAGLSDVTAIAAGDFHALALKSDGSIVAWGIGDVDAPAFLTDAVAISAGGGFSLALRQDGTVVGWGDQDRFCQQNPPAGLSDVVAIAAGGQHSLALKGDGSIVMWGTDSDESPIPSGLVGVTAIAAGGSHSLALVPTPTPAQLARLDSSPTFTGKVSAGSFSGDGSALTHLDPTQLSGTVPDSNLSENIARLDGRPVFKGTVSADRFAGRGDHLTDILIGSLVEGPRQPIVGWGKNDQEQLTIPPDLSEVVAIEAGHRFSLALLGDGSVVAWGSNDYHETNLPSGLADVAAIAAGYNHSLALKKDGTVVTWGFNRNNVLQIPVGVEDVVGIAAGDGHSLALKSDGTIIGWGDNEFGKATPPSGLSEVVAVAAGDFHSLALQSDGTVVAWGGNKDQQSRVPSDLIDVVAIDAGVSHSLALKNDGTVVAWGASSQATVPGDLTDVVAISAGREFSVALRRDGTVVAWGKMGAEGENVPPSDVRDVLAIAAGSDHTLAIRTTTVPAEVVLNHSEEVTLGGEFSGIFQMAADRDVQTDFGVVDSAVILEKLMTLPIPSWHYSDSPGVRHIGPAAQDFYNTFGFGRDERQIATIDSDGVALAAIQALKTENDDLRGRVEQLEMMLMNLIEGAASSPLATGNYE